METTAVDVNGENRVMRDIESSRDVLMDSRQHTNEFLLPRFGLFLNSMFYTNIPDPTVTATITIDTSFSFTPTNITSKVRR